MVTAAVHVDDFLSIVNSPEENWWFKEQMKEIWTISDLGEAKFVVGIGIDSNKESI